MGFVYTLPQLFSWYGTLKGTKMFKYGEETSIICECTNEEKMNREGYLPKMVAMATSHTLLR